MANNLGTLFLNIANALRSKNGLSTKYYPNQMADAILAIKTTPTLQNKSVSPSESSQTVVADSETLPFCLNNKSKSVIFILGIN